MRVPLDLTTPTVDDDHFDVEYHVQYSCLPKPGTWRQFTRFVSKYHNKPMDMNRPLWEVCMLDGLDGIDGIPKGSFALILKAHHAAVDGATGMQFFAAFSDARGRHSALSVPAEARAGAAPRTRTACSRMIKTALSIRLMDTLSARGARLLPVLFRKLSGGDDDRKLGVPDRAQQNGVAKSISMLLVRVERFQRIKSRIEGATITTRPGILCGALRKYLLAHKDLPDESLVAWVPINARPKDGSQGEGIGNQISAMTVPLFTDLARPDDRLAAITRQTRRSKEAKSGASAKLLTEMSQHFPRTAWHGNAPI